MDESDNVDGLVIKQALRGPSCLSEMLPEPADPRSALGQGQCPAPSPNCFVLIDGLLTHEKGTCR